MVIAYRYTGEETANLLSIFSSYDEDETGTLNVEDLRLQFALHDKYSSDEIDSIFSALVRSLRWCWISLISSFPPNPFPLT
jgi:Ca2+-binding EF-hand superfamily protein